MTPTDKRLEMRDRFACAALQGILAGLASQPAKSPEGIKIDVSVFDAAYQAADRMLIARKKKRHQTQEDFLWSKRTV